MIAVSFALFCLGAFGSAAAHHCPNDWVAFEHSCYAFLDIKVPWTSAKAFCELLGAKMLEVESKAENDFIVAQMSRSGLSVVWMGINDLVREGRWVYNSNGLPLSYSNWLSAYLDDYQKHEGGEDCGEMLSNGGWNDMSWRFMDEQPSLTAAPNDNPLYMDEMISTATQKAAET